MTCDSSADAFSSFFIPAFCFGIFKFKTRTKSLTFLAIFYCSAIIITAFLSSVYLFLFNLSHFRGDLEATIFRNENYAMTFFTMLHKIISAVFLAIVFYDNIFKRKMFLRLLKALDHVARNLNCFNRYIISSKNLSISIAIFLFVGYTVICILEYWAWVSDEIISMKSFNMIHIFFCTDVWMIQEWSHFLVACATRFLFKEISTGLKV
jgi:hypothetical protein